MSTTCSCRVRFSTLLARCYKTLIDQRYKLRRSVPVTSGRVAQGYGAYLGEDTVSTTIRTGSCIMAVSNSSTAAAIASKKVAESFARKSLKHLVLLHRLGIHAPTSGAVATDGLRAVRQSARRYERIAIARPTSNACRSCMRKCRPTPAGQPRYCGDDGHCHGRQIRFRHAAVPDGDVLARSKLPVSCGTLAKWTVRPSAQSAIPRPASLAARRTPQCDVSSFIMTAPPQRS